MASSQCTKSSTATHVLFSASPGLLHVAQSGNKRAFCGKPVAGIDSPPGNWDHFDRCTVCERQWKALRGLGYDVSLGARR